MIFGDINNVDEIKNSYPISIMKAIKYLKENDFINMKPGVYEIDGKNIYAQVVEKTTKERIYAKPEVHREYIDVQFSVEGKEIIGFARDSSKNKVSEDLLKEEDVLFYENVQGESDLVMNPGNFAVFFPNDVHRPWCAIDDKPCTIKKVNVKVSIKSL